MTTNKNSGVITSHSRSPRASRESGMAAGELLVLTVPICVLSMAIASKFAATSSARAQGQWHSALTAQQQTVGPCVGDTDLWMTAPALLTLKKRGASKALVPMLPTVVPVPGVSDPIALVGKKRVDEDTPVPGYMYKPHADRAVPDGINSVPASATFVCNEPNHGDERSTLYTIYLVALGEFQAAKLFGIVGGKSDPSGGTSPPQDPCEKGGGTDKGGSTLCDSQSDD